PTDSAAVKETREVLESAKARINAISSLMLARKHGLNASLSLKIVTSCIYPALLYGCEVLSPKTVAADRMYLEKAQVVVNKALRKVVGAYDRCHVAHLHFFCGLWRVEALAKFRRLMTVARWFARRTQNEVAIRAYELAHRHELPFYVETQESIEQLGIQQAWNKALVTFKTID